MNRSEVADGVLHLYAGQAEVYALPLGKMLWYSTTRPWSYALGNWRVLDDGVYTDGLVQASITFDAATGGLSVRYKNTGSASLRNFVAGLTLPLDRNERNKVTLPHILYNDNPSADPEHLIPHIDTVPGKGVVVEEHRLPIPAVNAEWQLDGQYHFLTLLSIPQVILGDEEEYWSLGVVKERFGERVLALSGPVMFNGMKDVAYYGQRTPMPHLRGYRVLEAGEEIDKEFRLSWGVTAQGRGFRDLVRLGYETLRPQNIASHDYARMIAFKQQVVDTRALNNAACSGYQTFGSANAFGDISRRPDFFLYGWTGQSLKVAWCECVLGTRDPAQRFRLDRGLACVDFFVRRSEGVVPGLLRGYYMVGTDSFQGAWDDGGAPLSSRMQGENMSDLVDVLTFLREQKHPVPEAWERFCQRACAFLMDERSVTRDGIYPLEWRLTGEPVSDQLTAAGMSCVLGLAKAAGYFSDSKMLRFAAEKYALYAHKHMDTFDIPFAHATRDAKCEDKEAGIYFFEAAAALHELTGEARFQEWAEVAADWILTFVYFWETGFREGTLCWEKGFRTSGWPGVSVQNHHLDVFFPTYTLYGFGKRTGNRRLMEMALMVSRAMTQGVCTREGEWGYTVVGEQGEQYYQTNYFQLKYPTLLPYINQFRGGMQVWNPLWITAQILSNAIRFHFEEGMP